ncbi:FtsX-like permease family protein [Adlercreutzia sp. ZJ304]|uniref:FtsX-like permease family protein n=1 Tax=Adlercreutzia sp. ZJ304 TaxID=2709791 RepID=UPI0013EA6861|nr:FtsX-like permease family protein [Adlercreutzia sp. ZJ304]
MLLKLAWRNIRHSVRDYTIYFLTLLFGVAVFYAFNSIGSQEVMFDLESQADVRQFETTQVFMGMFSWLIACVLGFLILYSNGFLIKRRKREFGTYMLLGMSSRNMSLIMLIETIMVGVVSLVLGLVVGFLLSQAMSFFTASLFGATIKNYQFVFSPEALGVTIVSFVVIYVVVAIFNTFSVNRCKLIDLLYADSKNQKVAVRNPWVCLVVFIVSVGVLAYAYQQLIESGMVMLDDPRFIRATVCMLIGTFMLFWSLAGFVIAVLTHARGVYLRGLVPFTVRQIASRVNTAFLSLWAVCVMLFFSITVFSIGMGLVNVFTDGIEEANPYSATLSAEIYSEDTMMAIRDTSEAPDSRAKAMQAEAPERYESGVAYNWDMAAALRENAPQLWDETIANNSQVDFYFLPSTTYGNILEQVGSEALDKLNEIQPTLKESNLLVISLSDLNAARALTGQTPVQLQADECVMVNNMDISKDVAEMVVEARPTIDAMGTQLTFVGDMVDTQLEDNAIKATAVTIVVPDYAIDNLRSQGAIPSRSVLNVMYAENGKSEVQNDEALGDIIAATQPKDMGGFEKGTSGADDKWASLLWPVTRVLTAHEMITQSGGLKMLITYLALYIGFVFLISTAAILAVQQLSQTTDSLPRYRMLSRIGCSQRMINRSLLVQLVVYFLLPLVVAVCHSACAIGVMSEQLFDALGVSVVEPIAMAAAFVGVIYGGYMLVTYLTSRNVVKGAK